LGGFFRSERNRVPERNVIGCQLPVPGCSSGCQSRPTSGRTPANRYDVNVLVS
jgi:hypothetical protein